DLLEKVDAGEAARGQVGNEPARARVPREVAEPGERRALAAAEGEVEDAGVGQRVDGPGPLGEPPLAGGPGRRRAGVATLAAGVAAVGEREVGLERRRQRPRTDGAVAGRVGPARSAVVAERARVVAIDEDQRPRPLELDDAAEGLGAERFQG